MSVILEKARQLEWEQRKQQGAQRRRRSEWVIDRLRSSLPPHHIALANRLLDLQATAEGIAPSGREAVDGGGNHREVQMHHRCDAQRALCGFEAAIRTRIGANGARCFWAIVWGNSFAETIRVCDYKAGSHGMVRRLVQLVMLAAEDYDADCMAQRKASALAA